MMAKSVNPAIDTNPSPSLGQCDPVAMIGPRSTVPIRASGHVAPHEKGRTHDRN
jgi:hypothetical protein